MPAPSFPPVRFVQAAVILGALAAVVSTATVWRLFATRRADMARYQACQAGTRSDCEPSLFWVLAGLVPGEALGSAAVPADGATGKRVLRTSDQAPVLTSLKPEGFLSDGAGGYRVATGTRVDITATVENARRVDLRLRPAGGTDAADVVLQQLLPVDGQDHAYRAAFTWTEPRSGDLIVTAYGDPDRERTTLVVPLRVGSLAE